MIKEMFVIAMRYPKDVMLPDILEEDDGKVMYFKSKKEAENYLRDIFLDKGINVDYFSHEHIEYMRVQ